MTIQETKLKGCFILQPEVFEDNRGYFFESFNKKVFEQQTGLSLNFVQDNESGSKYGVVRGLHFQKGEYAQSKLIRVIFGKIWDIAVDIRKDSPTYGTWFGVELSAENKKQIYIPKGFAHGFSTLENNTIVSYKCDQFYDKNSEYGINAKDPNIAIDWKIPEREQIRSAKDSGLPFLI